MVVQKGDLFYDVCAGVGPFAIQAAVKGKPTKKEPKEIKIFANDLNPESYNWLLHNVKLNKVHESGHVECYNKGDIYNIHNRSALGSILI